MSRRLLLRMVLGLLAAANLVSWVRSGIKGGIHNDFASYLTFAYLGVHSGWSHIYDWQLTRTIVPLFGAPYWPNQYPPYVFWLYVPLLYLPYTVAYFTWLALMSATLLATWRLLAPAAGRVEYLLVMLAALPVGFCLLLGQVIPLVCLTVALAWRLLEDRRDILAGVVLTALVLKPNLALLVPLVLVFAGRWRALAAFAVAGSAVLLAGFLALTPYGVEQFASHLRSVAASQSGALTGVQLDLAGSIGIGPLLIVLDLCVVAALAAIVRLTRADGLAAGFAAALQGSLLVTPYLHWQDLAILLPAGWLWLRSGPALRLALPVLALVWLDADFTLAVPQIGLLWLGVMLAVAGLRTAPALALRARVFAPSALDSKT